MHRGSASPGNQWFVDIVIPYLPKLEEMRSLSDPQHRLFFDYVVAQEEVQLAASQAVVDGTWQDGADLIQAFLPQARSVLAQLTQVTTACGEPHSVACHRPAG